MLNAYSVTDIIIHCHHTFMNNDNRLMVNDNGHSYSSVYSFTHFHVHGSIFLSIYVCVFVSVVVTTSNQ